MLCLLSFRQGSSTLAGLLIEVRLASSFASPLPQLAAPFILYSPTSSQTQNGPIHFNSDFSAIENAFSWNKAADVFWIDQPVGTLISG
jgi:Serine carboxypeptidase